jgi:ribosome-binding protein aMBF1 (putative translation factor)
MERETIPPDLGARINEARRRAGLGVVETARACDISLDHLSDILAGKRTPNDVVARRLIEVLEMDDVMADELIHHATGRYLSAGGFGTVLTDSL